jgi:hypothetical protein
MTIKGNVDGGVINVLASDTVIVEPSSLPAVERIAVSGLSLHNTAVGTVIVELYQSPDLTSASGDRLAYYSIAPNESADITELMGQGFLTNIIAVGDAIGVNAKVSYTTYTAGD